MSNEAAANLAAAIRSGLALIAAALEKIADALVITDLPED